MASPPHWSPEFAEPEVTLSRRAHVFALNATAGLGAAVAQRLGLSLSAHEERDFEDGEHKIRPLEPVANAEAYVIQSLDGDASESANDKLCKLLFFVGALKDAGAQHVTAITPYLCYARKDRRTQPLDPVTTRYVAALFEAVGTDAVVTLDVHNPAAFQNAFRRRAVSLTAAPLFVDFAARLAADERLCVVSPDPGGAKRAEIYRRALETVLGRPVGKALADKHREGGVVSGDLFAGDVADATALIIDDLVSTGTTLRRAAQAAKRAGARKVVALVTHALLKAGATEALQDPAIDRLVVTDAVAMPTEAAAPIIRKIDVLPVAPLLAAAVRRLHEGRSLADMLAP